LKGMKKEETVEGLIFLPGNLNELDKKKMRD
jgi:hypothetical protein